MIAGSDRFFETVDVSLTNQSIMKNLIVISNFNLYIYKNQNFSHFLYITHLLDYVTNLWLPLQDFETIIDKTFKSNNKH